jgi:AmmeMemoRadiSam system protein B
MERVRQPAVAGTFYAASSAALAAQVDGFLAAASRRSCARAPKAIIAPHAGYVYSGAIAASAFAQLEPVSAQIRRCVIIGPAHRVRVTGLASPGATRMRTPLGDVEVDVDAIERLRGVAPSPEAHAREHSIEVELPFVQRVLPSARVVPLAAGDASPDEVARVLDALWDHDDTAIVISSDLSHYLPYDEARAVDERTADRIVALDPSIDFDEACGAVGVNGLLSVARARGMRAERLDLRSSGDTAGPKDEVVGYGAFAFYEGPS